MVLLKIVASRNGRVQRMVVLGMVVLGMVVLGLVVLGLVQVPFST